MAAAGSTASRGRAAYTSIDTAPPRDSPNSGPFSTVGEGQIVFRQQQKPAERDQILHRHLLGQHQPVGAGDRNTALFQRAQQVADKLVAAAHQHHDVAGPQCAVARLQTLAGGRATG